MKTVKINENDAGQRLDRFISKSAGKLPGALMHKYIRKGRIKLNGKRTSNSIILAENDILELYINDEFFSDKIKNTGKKGNIEISYEDKNIIILNKPVGLAVHSGENITDTLLDRVLYYLHEKGEYDPEKENSFSPAFCNRLDRNTAGLVICAKNSAALRIMNERIKEREIKKFYICSVSGILAEKEKVLKYYMKKDNKINKTSVSEKYSRGYKEIITSYRVVKEKNETSLLEIELITGRSHQIRAQLAYIGHPLTGDVKYGGVKTKGYQNLISYKIVFDFLSDAGILNYLKNTVIEIEADFD